MSRRDPSGAREDFWVSTRTASPAEPRNCTPERSMTSSRGCCSSWPSRVERSTGAVNVSTSPTTVTVTTPSSPVEVESVITSSKGASVPSVATSGCPSAGRSEVVTDSGSSRRQFPGGGDRPDNLPLRGPGACSSPIPQVVKVSSAGELSRPARRGCLLNRDYNVDTAPRTRQPRPPEEVRGAGCTRTVRSAVGEVDGPLLGTLATHGRVAGGLDVIGRAVGAGVGVRGGVQVLLELHGRPARVLGRPDVEHVVREFSVQPPGERLTLGLLEGGGAEVDARVRPLAGHRSELRVLHPVLLGHAVLQVWDAVVLEGDVAGGLALGGLRHSVASVLRGEFPLARPLGAGPAEVTGVGPRPYPGSDRACAGVPRCTVGRGVACPRVVAGSAAAWRCQTRCGGSGLPSAGGPVSRSASTPTASRGPWPATSAPWASTRDWCPRPRRPCGPRAARCPTASHSGTPRC